jgi:PAS domain S-box-containing protein
MSGVSGIDLCKRIKSDPVLCEIPVIVTSAFVGADEWQEGLSVRGVDFLPKSFSSEELCVRVRTQLDLASAQKDLFALVRTEREANERLRSEIVLREEAERISRDNLERAERSRLALLSMLEDRKRADLVRERLVHIIESSVNEIYVFNAETLRFEFLNKGALENIGYTMDEMRRMTPVDIKPDYTEDTFRAAVGPLLRGERQMLVFETRHRRKDGTCYPVEVHLQLVDVGGSRVFLAVITDITVCKRDEDELMRYRTHLEELVTKRTEELEHAVAEHTTTNEKLLTTVEELNKTNDELMRQRVSLEKALSDLHAAQRQIIASEKMSSLGVLAAGVAHEINNPLNYIQGGINALELSFKAGMTVTDPDVAVLLDAMKEGVRRAAAIVTSLGHYSRKESNSRQRCDVHTIIEHCLVILQSQYRFKVTLACEYSAETSAVIGDEGRLHQAFLNILANAGQAITERGHVRISTKVIDARLQVTVSDDGCGVSEAHMKRIFDPFFTTKAPGQGTGLGLAITQSIVREHGGSIDFVSQLGKGTTVTIFFPVAEAGGAA